jgi:PAP2 superfamily
VSSRPDNSAVGLLVWTLREHRWLLGLVLGYAAGVAAFCYGVGEWRNWRWLILPMPVAYAALLGSVFLLAVEAFLRGGQVDLRAERVASAALVLLLVPPMQGAFHSFKQTMNMVRPFSWDARLANADAWLHGGVQPWQWLSLAVDSSSVTRAVDLLYFLWLPIFFGFIVWAAWSRQRALRKRVLITLVLLWIVLGSGAAYGFSSMGPCFYAFHPDGRPAFGPLMQTLYAHHQSRPLLAMDAQWGLWHGFRHHVWLPFGGISAMPSLHVAVATLIALAAAGHRRWPVWLLAGYALVVQVGSVMLGWHYAVDGYVAMLVTAGLWKAVGRACTPELRESDRRLAGVSVAAVSVPRDAW